MTLSTRPLLAAALSLSAATPHAAAQFTDWTTASANSANGTLGTTAVTLSGTYVNGVVLDGTNPLFSGPSFTPALAQSDWIEIRGQPTAATYTLSFSQAVLDPILHLGSLASTLVFAGINPVFVSGDSIFQVSGNTVNGAYAGGSADANGTVRLPGSYSSFSFTAAFAPGNDGIAIQVGAVPAVPEPSSMALSALGLVAVGLWVRRRRT